jgi:hypothetical protein
MKIWGPRHWHKVWNNWQRRLLFDQGPEYEKETGRKILIFHMDFANTWAMRQQFSICCEQPPNIYQVQVVLVVSTNPRYNKHGQLLYDNEIFSFWAEKSTDEVDKDYYLVQNCVKKVLDTYEDRKSHTDDKDKEYDIFHLTDSCAGEFK